MNGKNTSPQSNNKYNSFHHNIEELKTLRKNNEKYEKLLDQIRKKFEQNKDNSKLQNIVRSEINKISTGCKYVPGYMTNCSKNISSLKSFLPKKINTQKVEPLNKKVINEWSFLRRLSNRIRRQVTSPRLPPSQ